MGNETGNYYKPTDRPMDRHTDRPTEWLIGMFHFQKRKKNAVEKVFRKTNKKNRFDYAIDQEKFSIHFYENPLT